MRKYEYSDELVDLIKEYMVINDKQYCFYEDLGIFELTIGSRGIISKMKYMIDVHEEEIIVYGIYPKRANNRNLDMMSRMAEFICRANYGLKDGCFEFDFEDGEICYKSYINCNNLYPSPEIIGDSMRCVEAMLERYSKGMTDIIFNNYLAEDAIIECEKNRERIYQRTQEEEDGEELEREAMLEHLALCLGIVEN